MIFILIILCIIILVLLYYLLERKRRIQQIIEILEARKEEESKQLFLIYSNDDIAKLQQLLNEMICDYEKQLESFLISTKANQQLMTNLSHDIRTPMTTLMGYLDVIYSGCSSEKRKKYIKLARDKACDLKTYIDVLFEWFRLNSDEEVFNIVEVDIIELTRDVLKDWILVLEENGISYEVRLPDEEVFLKIDCYCYLRIINNIMKNILIHSYADNICIIGQKNGAQFELKIKDNGIGISNEKIKYIFERLYKCDESRMDKGNGLGLNIVKMLTEKMGGSVTAFSEKNEGTTFVICFSLEENN